MSLFKQEKPKKACRVYRAESLNPSEGISLSYRVSDDQRKHTVCLCLANRTVKTTFPSEFSAFEQMRKYRSLYKIKGSQK